MIEMFSGLHGWGTGAVAEGFRVVGFDIFDMPRELGLPRPQGDIQLVLQDVLTLHGSQFREAALIVASPPCQFFSYCAMPWSRAKKLAAEVRADPARTERELALFKACFRIQREAIEAAGRFIPLVVENVKGIQPWVGRSRWNYGSFHLFGDVPALMPQTRAIKVPGFRFDGSGKSFQTASVEETGVKAAGMNWSDPTLRGQDFTRIAAGQKTVGHANKRDGNSHTRHLTNQAESDAVGEGRKGAGAGAGAVWFDQNHCQFSSKNASRKAASAAIAKIPLPLARFIARTYHPKNGSTGAG